jgi:hypothetical protein
MANRSYVYSVDAVPTKEQNPKPIRSLSEYNWDIPLAHKILASGAPRRCQSAIWEKHEIAIVGDYAVGKDRLIRFLDALAASGRMAKKDDFSAAVKETKEVLASEKHAGKLILLEAGEIFDMSGEGLVEGCDALVEEISGLAKRVDDAITGQNEALLRKVAEGWEKDLGLYWADVLYFDFGV